MTKVYRIFKTQLLMTVVLFGVRIGFAQTVTVPSNCIVVSTNTTLGGILGAGGKVTSGGVVTMADAATPNGGTFTFAGPAGVTLGPLISWSLSGDLSNTATAGTLAGIVGNYNGQTQPPNGTSATIISYNKFFRPSEGVSSTSPLNNPSWARSKGKVTVGYTTNLTLCPGVFIGGNVSFEIFKRFTATPVTNVPKIVGPACVEAGVQATFSVDQIVSDNANDNIGFDQYYWSDLPTLQSGSTQYFSADRSSITFTPATSASFTIKCNIGQANPWNGGTAFTRAVPGTTFVTKFVGAAPSQPVFVGGPPNGLCVGTGTGANPFTLTYTSPNTCTWTAANTGWTIASQTAGSVTINTNGFNNPGVLTLTVSNGTCTPLTFLYQINRKFGGDVAIAPVNTSLTTNCLNIGSTSNTTSGQNIFAISTSAAANQVTWSVTLANSTTAATGFSFTQQAVSSSIGLNVLATASVGSYELKATNICGAILKYPFTVRPNAVTINATSPSCVTRGGGAVTYTCTTSSGATGYLWSFPAGFTPATTFTTTTNSISVTPTSTAAAGNVTVTPLGTVTTCNGVASANYKVNLNAIAPTGITPSACVTVGSTSATLTVTNAQNFGTYTVTSTPVGITGTITGNGVIPITLPENLTAGSYALVVTHSNSSTVAPIFNCGSASFNYTLTVGSNPYSIFTLTSAPNDTFFISGAPTGATYAWYVNNNLVATPPNPNQLVLQGTGTIPTSVFCNVTFNGCTTKMVASLVGVTHSQRITNNGFTPVIEDVTVYPNPNKGDFTINVPKVKEIASATLYDTQGREIETFNLQTGENTIQKEDLRSGYYILSITVDGVLTAQKIKVKN
jgi:Secretion system C-terminal sorting domain/PKD-like domain